MWAKLVRAEASQTTEGMAGAARGVCQVRPHGQGSGLASLLLQNLPWRGPLPSRPGAPVLS